MSAICLPSFTTSCSNIDLEQLAKTLQKNSLSVICEKILDILTTIQHHQIQEAKANEEHTNSNILEFINANYMDPFSI